MRAPPSRERGVALVLVVFVVTLLLVVAGSFAYSVRIDARAARNAALIAKGEALAQAAISRTAIEMFKTPGSPEVWKREDLPRQWTFDGAEISVRFTDESAKIDINSANNELLKGLFRYAGLGEEEAVKLLDALLDWRDADSLRRPFGAEEPEYAQAGLKGRPADYPFQATEELQLVLGMRPEVYQRIAPMITVYSRQPGVNPYYATRGVLLAIPGVTAEQVDAYIAERDAALRDQRLLPAFTAAGAFASYAQAGAATIRADVTVDGHLKVAREAVIVISPQFPRRPYAVLAWREPSREADRQVAAAPETPLVERR
ncbi:MAG: general secretion pathway protein GspK [Betaproteobacteria bacterium]|nr:general secretion pathway protein GspK [Betaproteobacteria bacterium]